MFQDPSMLMHITSHCVLHPTLIQSLVCTSSCCNQRLLCQECYKNHYSSHKHEVIPMSELLNDNILHNIDKKIDDLVSKDKQTKTIFSVLDELDKSLETMLATLKKQLYYTHRVIGKYRQKVEEKSKTQKHTFDDWLRFKDYFCQKRENFLTSSTARAPAQLEAFAVHYGSLISKLDEDNNTSEEDVGVTVPAFDQSSCDRFMAKTLRDIEDYYNHWFLQIFPKGPKGKLEKKTELVRSLNSSNKTLWSMDKSPNNNHTSRLPTTFYSHATTMAQNTERRNGEYQFQDSKITPSPSLDLSDLTTIKAAPKVAETKMTHSLLTFSTGNNKIGQFVLSNQNIDNEAANKLDDTIIEFPSNDEFQVVNGSSVTLQASKNASEVSRKTARIFSEKKIFYNSNTVFLTGESAHTKDYDLSHLKPGHKRIASCSSAYKSQIK